MCQNPVGSGTVSKACSDVATLASSIIRGGGFPDQNKAVFGNPPSPANLVVIVEKTDPKDSKRGDCGEPTTPCTF